MQLPSSLAYNGNLDINNTQLNIMQISQISSNEKNTILQAWDQMKQSIFNVLFVLLDKNSQQSQEQQSIMGLVTESGLDFLQMLAFPFGATVLPSWNGGQTLNSLSQLMGKANISAYLPGVNFTTYLSMLYGLIFLIILVIVDIIYVSYSFNKKKFKFTFPLVILAQIVPLFVTVLFLPISQTLLSIVECELVDNALVMTNFQTVTCWQGWHLFHSVITLLFTSIFVFISCVVALALFQPRMSSKKLTARQNSNGELVFIMNKVIVQFIFSFKPFQDPFPYVLMMFVLGFWLFYGYTIRDPYYDRSASKFFKIASTYYFWTTLMLLISEVFRSRGFDGGLVIWLGGLPFFAVIIIFETTSNVDTFFKANLKFKTGQELQAHIGFVLNLIQNQEEDKNSYMLLIGYVEKHKEICTEADCPLRLQKKQSAENRQNLIKQIDRMYRFGVKKFQKSSKLRMSYAFFHLQWTKEKQKAFQQFGNASKTSPSFQQQFNIYRFRKIIKQNLQSKEQKSSDLIQTIKFDNHVSLCQQAMLLSAKLHKEFWIELKEETPDLQKLNKIGAQITETSNAVKQNYTELSKINNSSPQVLYSYAMYLILISEDMTGGRDIMATAQKLYQDKVINDSKVREVKFNSIYKLAQPVLVVDAKEETHGQVLNFNLMFAEVFGYKKDQLYHYSQIMPRLYGSHKQSYFNLQNEFQQEAYTATYVKTKLNNIVPIQYLATYQPIEQSYNIEFKFLPSSQMVLLVDRFGQITDYTAEAEEQFKKCDSLKQMDILNHEDVRYRTGQVKSLLIDEEMQRRVVVITPIQASKYQEQQSNEDDEQRRLINVGEECIGYSVQIKDDRVTDDKMLRSSMKRESLLKRLNNAVPPSIMQMYRPMSVLERFVANLIEQQLTFDKENGFILKKKIKTMRLLNNEIKMVSDVQNDGQYEESVNSEEEENQEQAFKFQNQQYQKKLKEAINTNLNHNQVSNLRLAFFLFLLSIFVLDGVQTYYTINQVGIIDTYLTEINNRAVEFRYLSTNVMSTFAREKVIKIQNHTVQFSTKVMVGILQVEVTMRVVNGDTTKNLVDAFILLYSLLNAGNNPIQVYGNYIGSIYPSMRDYSMEVESDTVYVNALVTTILCLSLCISVYWVYSRLKIDKKRYDIMIWFLDIPVPYVTHLSLHCDKYLKHFLPIKQLGQKGIGVNAIDDEVEEYVNVKSEDDEMEQQIKARKSLIAKNKKSTLCSKVTVSDLQVVWLVIYSIIFSAFLLIFFSSFYSSFAFLNTKLGKVSQQIIEGDVLQVALSLQQGHVVLPGVDIPSLIAQIRAFHMQGNPTFNLDILSFSNVEAADLYSAVYYGDLCGDNADCGLLLGGRLRGGYKTYSSYVGSLAELPSQEYYAANEQYILPALLSLINGWRTLLIDEAGTLVGYFEKILYVYIVMSLILFLVVGTYHFRKLNTELNQTIQMLNMIPFKLLPKSRKETRDFIGWIIKEANKVTHEEY